MNETKDELNRVVATYCYSSDCIEIHRSFDVQYIYLRTTRNEPLPDFTRDMNAHIERLFPVLTARCCDPEIYYDHEMDQWIITLHSWTSGCSKDSPVAYCKEADEIPRALCECVAELRRQLG